MPDGRLVTVGGYPDKQDGYSNRFITAIDDKGKRTKTSMGPVFSFEPAYLNGGSTLVVIDQVLKGDDFVYPLVTWDFATKKRGTLDITLPKGQMVSWMWSVPDFKSIVMAVGKEGEGYDIYRFDPASKTPVRLTEKKFASCYGGSITPDGKKLLFVGSLPAVKGEEVWVLDL
jgi:Tol biopolymer transport system component